MESHVEYTLCLDMPENIEAILSEFKDIFPVDLPVGRLPVPLGLEFKTNLQDDIPRPHADL